jgi:hypothetical protein
MFRALPLHQLSRYVDFDFAVGSPHHVDVSHVADVSEVHAASIHAIINLNYNRVCLSCKVVPVLNKLSITP